MWCYHGSSFEDPCVLGWMPYGYLDSYHVSQKCAALTFRMEGYCSPLRPRRQQSSTIVGVRIFVLSAGLHPVLCCTRDSYPCILDLLINCRLHRLDRRSAGAMYYGLGVITSTSPMISWLWPLLFSSSSHSFFCHHVAVFLLSNLAASLCTSSPHLFHSQTEQLVRQVFCQP